MSTTSNDLNNDSIEWISNELKRINNKLVKKREMFWKINK
jgi:hypothetical protein